MQISVLGLADVLGKQPPFAHNKHGYRGPAARPLTSGTLQHTWHPLGKPLAVNPDPEQGTPCQHSSFPERSGTKGGTQGPMEAATALTPTLQLPGQGSLPPPGSSHIPHSWDKAQLQELSLLSNARPRCAHSRSPAPNPPPPEAPRVSSGRAGLQVNTFNSKPAAQGDRPPLPT